MKDAEAVASAIDGWYMRNVPHPRIGLIAPARLESMVNDFFSDRYRPADKSKGIKVCGVEIAPDPRVDPGIVVFVDEDFKFVGATVLP